MRDKPSKPEKGNGGERTGQNDNSGRSPGVTPGQRFNAGFLTDPVSWIVRWQITETRSHRAAPRASWHRSSSLFRSPVVSAKFSTDMQVRVPPRTSVHSVEVSVGVAPPGTRD
ncbi:hypothetical protein GCM10009525_13830 [Streptosporangium amethystogenes subsp. fukuiense]